MSRQSWKASAPTDMPGASRQPPHDVPIKSVAPDPETAATDQGQPSPQHTPGQQTGDLYVIHDMITKGQRTDANAVNGDEPDFVKILEDLNAEMSRHRSSNVPRSETASSDTATQILLTGAENGQPQLQHQSWIMRRWKSQLFETRPWHCPELVSDTRAGVSRAEELQGTDAQEENRGDGTFNGAEEAWSNMASVGAGEEDRQG